jgi:hypothetical protein
VVGVITLLKHFHSSNLSKYYSLSMAPPDTASDTSASCHNTSNASPPPSCSGSPHPPLSASPFQRELKQLELPLDVVTVLNFLEEFIRFAAIDRKVIYEFLPPYIFDEFRHA